VPYAELTGTTLYYEVTTSLRERPLLMIEGLGAQLTMWTPGLIAKLERAGFGAIRYDARDVGLSATSVSEFTLADMVQDAYELLRHLGLEKAHVVGQSMGGMVAQQLAIDHPESVMSMVLVYSAPNASFRADDPGARTELDPGPAHTFEEAVDQFIRIERVSGLQDFTETEIRAYAESVIARDYEREAVHHGQERHAKAVVGAADRTEELRGLRLPVAVIHGRDDRLISYRGGIATAEAVPDAELHVFANMGHELRPALWDDYVRIIDRTAARAQA
jgi:pimeloyl-ACP methyl ester carboxylesterase